MFTVGIPKEGTEDVRLCMLGLRGAGRSSSSGLSSSDEFLLESGIHTLYSFLGVVYPELVVQSVDRVLVVYSVVERV